MDQHWSLKITDQARHGSKTLGVRNVSLICLLWMITEKAALHRFSASSFFSVADTCRLRPGQKGLHTNVGPGFPGPPPKKLEKSQKMNRSMNQFFPKMGNISFKPSFCKSFQGQTDFSQEHQGICLCKIQDKSRDARWQRAKCVWHWDVTPVFSEAASSV